MDLYYLYFYFLVNKVQKENEYTFILITFIIIALCVLNNLLSRIISKPVMIFLNIILDQLSQLHKKL